MKILTIRQPWASLIVAGIKDVENRSWLTSYRGRLGIHAGSRVEQDALDAYGHLLDGDLPRGALIGSVTLVDCISNSRSKWAEPGMCTGYWQTPRSSLAQGRCRGSWVYGRHSHGANEHR